MGEKKGKSEKVNKERTVTLNKNSVRGLTLPDFRLNCEATVMKCGISERMDKGRTTKLGDMSEKYMSDRGLLPNVYEELSNSII